MAEPLPFTRPSDWEEPVRLPDLVPPDRILVPFDGSHAAERALAWAARIAGSAEVIVLVAYVPPLTKKGRGAAYVEQMQAELSSEAKDLATEAVELLEAQGLQARGLVVRGDPAAAIASTVDEERVGLVVLGRRGLTAELEGLEGALEKVRSALHGGVAERAVRHATVPVLVVG